MIELKENRNNKVEDNNLFIIFIQEKMFSKLICFIFIKENSKNKTSSYSTGFLATIAFCFTFSKID